DFERFGADIVAVSEATWVEGQGRSAWERLNSGLQMEGHYVRANPWDEGQTPDESDQTVALRGFEEGEYLLSRFPFGTTKGYPLEPRTDFHERRVVLHGVLKVDEPVGEVDVFVTRLDGDEAT